MPITLQEKTNELQCPKQYLASACTYGAVSRLTRKLNSVALRCYRWKHIGDPWPHRLPSRPGSDNGTITGQRGLFLTTSSADRNSDWALEQALLQSTAAGREGWTGEKSAGCSFTLTATLSQFTRLLLNTNSGLTPSLDAVTVELKPMCVTLCRTPSFPLG